MRSIGKLFVGSVFALSVASVFTPPILAQEPNVETRQFGSEVGEIVLNGQRFMAEDKYEAALNALSEAQSLDELSPYEQSIIHQMRGSCFYELNQYDEAIVAFERAIAAGGLRANETRSFELNIAQLLIANDQFEAGAMRLEKWHRDGGVLKMAHIEMLWQAWSQAGYYDRALPWAEKWFNQASPKTRKHFDTLNFFYHMLDMSSQRSNILNQMAENWPGDTRISEALGSQKASE